MSTFGAAALLLAGSQTANASTVNVHSGDTVWGFSQAYHVSIKDIVKANSLADANLIYVNQKLTIPDGQSAAKATTSNTQAAATTNAQSKTQANTANTQSSATTSSTTPASQATAQSSQTSSASSAQANTANNAHHSATTTGNTTANGTTTSSQATTSTTTSSSTATRGGGIATALKIANSGVPYVYGGSSMSGFDCSGLVQYALGLSARTTYQQATLGTHHYDVANAPAGAILFWGSDSAPYHDGLSLGNGQYVAAQNPNDGIGTFSQTYWKPSFYIIP